MRKNRQTAKYHIKSYIIAGSLAGAISMALVLPVPVMAAQQSLASVTGQAQIQPMGDGSGKYMMKSDGFYCLDVNGAGSTQAEIHYFQDYEIDGTVFDGYYYHDTDGKFKACSPHMEHLKGVAVFGDKTDEEADTQNAQEAEKFDGYYFVNNLGRLSAAPQVRYIDNLAIDGITLNGYYYFDENFKLKEVVDVANNMQHIDISTVDENKLKEDIYENFKPILEELENNEPDINLQWIFNRVYRDRIK